MTLWLPADLAAQLDELLAAQPPSPLGARATRHGFALAAVRRAVDEATAGQRVDGGAR